MLNKDDITLESNSKNDDIRKQSVGKEVNKCGPTQR